MPVYGPKGCQILMSTIVCGSPASLHRGEAQDRAARIHRSPGRPAGSAIPASPWTFRRRFSLHAVSRTGWAVAPRTPCPAGRGASLRRVAVPATLSADHAMEPIASARS